MSAKEFIKLAVSGGYCSERIAKKYVETSEKSEFTDDDFIEVYRFSYGRPVPKNYTSKRLVLSEDEDPNSFI